MNEKKPIKVSLSTFFLLIAIIIITVMGYFMYKLYNDKVKATDKIEQLNNQINTLQNSANQLQTNINKISKENNLENNTVVSNNSNTNNDSKEKNTNNVQKTTEDVIKELFLKKLEEIDSDSQEKIVDYRVDKVKILDDIQKKDIIKYYDEKDVLVLITYSLKPKDINNTLWTAGNGHIEGDWIVDKSACNYLRDGELYGGFATGW